MLYYWHTVANRFLTGLCNMVSDLNLTDMETCYKVFRTSLLRSIPLRSNRFGIEPELTIKVARREVRIYEMPISYHGRSYEEGKKIGFWDALQAVYVILRYSFTKDIYKGTGPEVLDVLSDARASTSGWPIPSGLTWASGCWRSAPGSGILRGILSSAANCM